MNNLHNLLPTHQYWEYPNHNITHIISPIYESFICIEAKKGATTAHYGTQHLQAMGWHKTNTPTHPICHDCKYPPTQHE